jgi:hypothetical protein
MEPPHLQPPPFPYALPPQQNDAEHLNLLSIFHYVFGGLAFLGLGFIAVHFFFMRMIFTRPEMFTQGGGKPPPPEMMKILVVLYGIMALMCILLAVVNILSGVFIRRRKHRMFSLILSGFNCLQMPFGTALGVFTFIVLARPSVRMLYGERMV